MAQAGKAIAGLGFGLALGAAVGVYALAPNLPSDNDRAAQERTEESSKDELAVAQAQLAAGDDFDTGLAANIVGDTLTGRPVLVLATHDAEQTDIDQLAGVLESAGAIDAGHITLEESFFDQEGADKLKNIIATTLAAGSQLSEERYDAGTHAGESFGSILMLDPETGEQQATVEDRALVLQSLRQADFIDYEDGTILPAQAIVLVTGNDDGANNAFAADNQASFAQALATRGSGVVVAGRVKAASDTGVLGILRSNDYADAGVSTVDSLERGWAKVVTVQAVAEQLDGSSGNYGVAAGTSGVGPGIRRSANSSDAQRSEESTGEESTANATTESFGDGAAPSPSATAAEENDGDAETTTTAPASGTPTETPATTTSAAQ